MSEALLRVLRMSLRIVELNKCLFGHDLELVIKAPAKAKAWFVRILGAFQALLDYWEGLLDPILFAVPVNYFRQSAERVRLVHKELHEGCDLLFAVILPQYQLREHHVRKVVFGIEFLQNFQLLLANE